MKLNTNFLIIVLGRLLQGLLGFASVRVMTTFLDKDQIGLVSVTTAMAMYFGLIFINPAGMYINRIFATHTKTGNPLSLYLFSSVFNFLVALFAVFFLSILSLFMKSYEGVSSSLLIAIVSTYIFFCFSTQSALNLINLSNHTRRFVFHAVLLQLLVLVFPLSVILFVGKTSMLWLAATIFANGVMMMMSGIYLWKTYHQEKFNFRNYLKNWHWKQMYQFCWPLSLSATFVWMLNQGYRVFVERWFDLETVGILAVTFVLAGSIMLVFESTLQQYFLPKYYQSLTDDFGHRKEAWRQLLTLFLIVMLPLTAYLFSQSELILKLLVNQKFHSYYLLLGVGFIFELLRILTNVYHLIFHSEKRTKRTLIPFVIGTVICLALFRWVMASNVEKLLGISVALLISFFATFLSTVFTSRNIFKGVFPVKMALVLVTSCIPYILYFIYAPKDLSFPALFVLAIPFGLYFLLTQYVFLKRYAGK